MENLTEIMGELFTNKLQLFVAEFLYVLYANPERYANILLVYSHKLPKQLKIGIPNLLFTLGMYN